MALKGLSVADLRTMCNQKGMSCRDQQGKFLTKAQMLKVLQQHGGAEIGEAEFWQHATSGTVSTLLNRLDPDAKARFLNTADYYGMTPLAAIINPETAMNLPLNTNINEARMLLNEASLDLNVRISDENYDIENVPIANAIMSYKNNPGLLNSPRYPDYVLFLDNVLNLIKK